jgi:hypothetical protein
MTDPACLALMLLPKRGETAGTALASCDASFSFLAVLSLVLYGHVRISFLLAGDSIRQRTRPFWMVTAGWLSIYHSLEHVCSQMILQLKCSMVRSQSNRNGFEPNSEGRAHVIAIVPSHLCPFMDCFLFPSYILRVS